MTESFDLIIRNARIVTPSGVVVGDLATLDGQIAAIGQFAGTAVQEVDASGRYVMPGGVDPHCHIEQMSGMGVWNADTFETATKSAAMGGTTSVISFAAQQQGEPLRQTIANYAARAARGAMIDHAFHITVTDVAVPEFDRDLADLICAGHRSIKVFTTYNIKLSDRAILDLMVQARRSGALVCVHAENDDLIGWTRDGLIAAGLTAPHYHPVSHPRMAEIDSVERMIRYAEFLDQPVMLFHISTTEAVDAIARARGRGVPVWAETCPHYLFMTGDVIEQGAPDPRVIANIVVQIILGKCGRPRIIPNHQIGVHAAYDLTFVGQSIQCCGRRRGHLRKGHRPQPIVCNHRIKQQRQARL